MNVQNSLEANSPILFFWEKGLSLEQHAAKNILSKEQWSLVEAAVRFEKFEAKAGKTLVVHSQSGPIIFIGINADAKSVQWAEWGASAYKALKCSRVESASIWLGDINVRYAKNAIEGAGLRAYSFDKYKTKNKEKQACCLTTITWGHEKADELKEHEPLWNARTMGVHLTRDVVSEPPNVIYPESMASKAVEELEKLGVEVTVIKPDEMKKLGMGALLGVAQGSLFEPRLIILRWNKAPQKEVKAFVGKGVTFDSGGISIKPSNNMEDMKYDMAGSGVVLGLFKTLALRNAEVNAVGVMVMAENMPSGTAQRPADVVTSMSGQTIEVVNTDAEGRLILADALWYVQEKYQPKTIVDLATLTGAITVALGLEYAGLFSNSDCLSKELLCASECTGEPIWRMPLNEAYDRDIDSDIADMKNVGSGRGAGGSTAAHFLKRFIKEGVNWAHLDIAGMAWDKKNKPLSGKGATGFGVRLLDTWLMNCDKEATCTTKN